MPLNEGEPTAEGLTLEARDRLLAAIAAAERDGDATALLIRVAVVLALLDKAVTLDRATVPPHVPTRGP